MKLASILFALALSLTACGSKSQDAVKEESQPVIELTPSAPIQDCWTEGWCGEPLPEDDGSIVGLPPVLGPPPAGQAEPVQPAAPSAVQPAVAMRRTPIPGEKRVDAQPQTPVTVIKRIPGTTGSYVAPKPKKLTPPTTAPMVTEPGPKRDMTVAPSTEPDAPYVVPSGGPGNR